MEILARVLAGTINWVLALLVLAAPRIGKPAGPAAVFWARSALGIGLAVALAETAKKLVVWPGHPSFPSGHETFALAAVTCLIGRDRRWLWPGLACCLVLAWALVIARYHRPVDVVGALLVGPPAALLCRPCRPPKA